VLFWPERLFSLSLHVRSERVFRCGVQGGSQTGLFFLNSSVERKQSGAPLQATLRIGFYSFSDPQSAYVVATEELHPFTPCISR